DAMSQLQDILKDKEAMDSVALLTSAFEGIASMHVSRIKTRVERSEAFFAELWELYSQLIVDKDFHVEHHQPKYDRQLILIVTSEGSLSGDIDHRLIDSVLNNYNSEKQSLSVIGHHGAGLLQQRGVAFESVYRMPDRDDEFKAEDLLIEVQQYQSCTVYYQAYESLMVQGIRQVELNKAVQERGNKQERGDNYISQSNYIFEPSVSSVVEHMERSMKGITINEVILSSQLAQQASRFRAMSAARSRARRAAGELGAKLSYTKRTVKDERAREIVSGLRGASL
ncbi:MAG TPA: F0F1 ATP synthase subunit gamma, partial [Candidatus Saccharimonadales bacterium]|nr:F0F1 ATP synthase subunit gamma [Candidatus Saccharimonadales bacterium]